MLVRHKWLERDILRERLIWEIKGKLKRKKQIGRKGSERKRVPIQYFVLRFPKYLSLRDDFLLEAKIKEVQIGSILERYF